MTDAPPDSKPESVITVLIALGANLLIAIAKTVAAFLTGSASMVAESAHSWADAGNEVLLLIAERRSVKKPDARHPLGYGKDAYIWSMFAAFGLFTVGAAVSVQHGIQELLDPEPAQDYIIAYLVIAVAFVLEGISFVRAYRQAKVAARERKTSVVGHVLTSSNPTLRAVFAEDAAALIGLAIAFTGILLHQLTDNPMWDAIGSILVGILLGVVAVVLIQRNREFLLGQQLDAATRQWILDQLRSHPDIDRVTYLHAEFVGPGQLLVIAAVDLVGDLPEHEVGAVLRRIALDVENNEHVAEAALTLSAPGDADLLTAV